MPRNETLIVIMLLGTSIVGCEQPKEETPTVPQPIIDDIPDQSQKSSGKSFLDQKREIIDHDAKFRQRFEPDPLLIVFSDFQSPRPTGWTWTPPSSNLRIANYTLQGDDENESVELVIKQFTEEKGGELNANIERWKNHFRSDRGGPVRPIISKTIVAGLPTTIIEIKGEYMGMGASWHRYNYTMLIALIEYEKGDLFLRLLGPTQTIDVHRNSWKRFLEKTTNTKID